VSGEVRLVLEVERARLVLRGEVDARLSPRFREVISRLLANPVPVDVETVEVTFVDSAAIAMIAHLARQLPASVRFLAPTPQVRFLLELTQVEDLVEVVVPAPPQQPGPPSTSPVSG